MIRTLPLLLLFVAAAASAAVGDAAARIERTVYAMGTELRIVIEATDRAAAIAASEQALLSVAAVEERLSTWRDDSELSRLNRAAVGRQVRISEPLAADLETARWCWEATSGAFDPTVGALVRAWGLRHGGRRPAADDLGRALSATGMEHLETGRGTAVRRHTGLVLEEGGFGKGAGLDAALKALARDPRVVRAELDFGGQLAMLGSGTSWRFTLAHPRDRQREVLGLTLEGARISVATSGTSERGGHLLDPRTGRPAPDFGSLTVWTAQAARADCLSTGLYVLGPDKALAWAAEQPGVEVLVLEAGPGGRWTARATPGFAGRIRALDESGTIEIVETDSSWKEGSTTSP